MIIKFIEDTSLDLCKPRDDGSLDIEHRDFKEGDTLEVFIRSYGLMTVADGTVRSDATIQNMVMRDGRTIYGVSVDCYEKT